MCLFNAAKPVVAAAPAAAPTKSDAEIRAEQDQRRAGRNQSKKGFASHYKPPTSVSDNDNEDDTIKKNRIVLGG